MVEARGLRMRYGTVEVLHGIDIVVERGEVFCLLGPNGAGKTTTLEILEGFRSRTGGEVKVLGCDPESAGPGWRNRVGMVLQSSAPEPELTVSETLELYAGFYDAPRDPGEVLALVGLESQARTRNERLSGGQQRRLDVGIALIGNPELLFLDEPTTGFDPGARHAAWEMVAGLRLQGTTVLLTTHYLQEAEALADRIAVVQGGVVVAEGTPHDLGGRAEAPTEIVLHLPARAGEIASELDERFGAAAPAGADVPRTCELVGVAHGKVTLASKDALRDLYRLSSWLIELELDPRSIEVSRPSLEDVYLELVAEQGGR